MAAPDHLARRTGRIRAKAIRKSDALIAGLRALQHRPWPSDPDASGIVLVMGSGRSGTHWLGHVLDSHPDIRTTIESPNIFGCVTRMALNPPERWHLLPRLVEMYRRERAMTSELYYADKSHPSIWIAEYLADAIPSARFIGIERDPYQTVASALAHSEVSAWPTYWREFPVPNRFLGISKENAADYDRMTPVEQQAVRWISHSQRLEELRRDLGDRIRVLHYTELQNHTEETLAGIQRFLGLATAFPEPEIRRRSVDKWRASLDEIDIASIRSLTGVEPPL